MNPKQTILIHPHARERMGERGATEEEVVATIRFGERFLAKMNRHGFRRNFSQACQWRERWYHNKQIELYAVEEDDTWVVVTVIVKFF